MAGIKKSHEKYFQNSSSSKLSLLTKQKADIIKTLKGRFEQNMKRHRGIEWSKVLSRLEKNNSKLQILFLMEKTGGEPDVIAFDKTGEYVFCDCSSETPYARTNVCYDLEGQKQREKEGIQMKGNAVDMAKTMGIEMLDEEQYRELQKIGEFDLKTSSWLKTPEEIRKLGGALFGDRRYDAVFIYHNGAQSFYAARGWRGMLRV
jgi:hypothetical protein